MDRGQVSIEYSLLLIIILTLLSVLIIPFVNSSLDKNNDVLTALMLSSSAKTLQSTAKELSVSSCGSFKTVPVYQEPRALAEPTFTINGKEVNISFYDFEDNQHFSTITLPVNISEGSYSNRFQTFVLERDCS